MANKVDVSKNIRELLGNESVSVTDSIHAYNAIFTVLAKNTNMKLSTFEMDTSIYSILQELIKLKNKE